MILLLYFVVEPYLRFCLMFTIVHGIRSWTILFYKYGKSMEGSFHNYQQISATSYENSSTTLLNEYPDRNSLYSVVKKAHGIFWGIAKFGFLWKVKIGFCSLHNIWSSLGAYSLSCWYPAIKPEAKTEREVLLSNIYKMIHLSKYSKYMNSVFVRQIMCWQNCYFSCKFHKNIFFSKNRNTEQKKWQSSTQKSCVESQYTLKPMQCILKLIQANNLKTEPDKLVISIFWKFNI